MRDHAMLIYGCLGVQLLILSIIAYFQDFAPYTRRLTGSSLKRLRQSLYAVCALTWLVIGFAHWTRR